MSNEVYPQLPGLAYGVRRRPVWRTDVRTTPSQREYRSSDQILPRRRLTLVYDFLQQGLGFTEQEALEGFFNRHRGELDSFLLADPDDSQVVDQFVGLGDGVTNTYQLVRTRGGVVEAPSWINGTPQLTLSDWQGDRVRLSPAARTNLLLRSDNFGNAAWVKGGATTTTGAAAGPEGTGTTADLVAENSGTVNHNVRQAAAISPTALLAFAVYAKPAGRNIIKLRLQRADFLHGCSANFNLAAGTVGLVDTFGNGQLPTASITQAGNGYWRCEIVGQADTVADTTTLATVALMSSDVTDPTYTGDGSSGVHLDKAIAVAGSFAGRVINTTSAAVTAPADYSVASTGLATLAAAPIAGASLRWTGSYYWRARFAEAELDFEKFLDTLWRLGKVELLTTRS